MSAIEVCLVRHAQSVSNAAGVWQGQGDSPLSQLGISQVEALTESLASEEFDLAISSDLSRAAHTSRALGVDVDADPSWREIDVGDWEGLSMDEVVERFPEQIEALRDRKPFPIGGGESWPEVFARADAAFDQVRKQLPSGGRAIVFTHGGIIGSILAGLLGVRDAFPWPLGRMRNTGRTTLRLEGSRVELVSHNDDSHLGSELRQPYTPRPDQVVVRLHSVDDGLVPDTADFNSAIKSARKTSAGGVVSVSGSPAQVAALAHEASSRVSSEFRFLEPPAGHSSELLVSSDHRMLLDYAVPVSQI
jgi:probable phosphoglycerate mutase